MAKRTLKTENSLFMHHNTADKVVLALENMIIKRELKPNQRIYVDELSKQFNISQTPIREALYKLEGMDLINMKPRRGTYVANFTEEDILDILEIRLVLENLAIKKISNVPDSLIEKMRRNLHFFKETADEKDFALNNEIDRSFHLLIVEAANSRSLSRVYEKLCSHIGIQMLLYQDGKKALNELSTAYQEHRKIIEAFATKNKGKIKKAIRNHFNGVRRRIIKTKEEQMEKVTK